MRKVIFCLIVAVWVQGNTCNCKASGTGEDLEALMSEQKPSTGNLWKISFPTDSIRAACLPKAVNLKGMDAIISAIKRCDETSLVQVLLEADFIVKQEPLPARDPYETLEENLEQVEKELLEKTNFINQGFTALKRKRKMPKSSEEDKILREVAYENEILLRQAEEIIAQRQRLQESFLADYKEIIRYLQEFHEVFAPDSGETLSPLTKKGQPPKARCISVRTGVLESGIKGHCFFSLPKGDKRALGQAERIKVQRLLSTLSIGQIADILGKVGYSITIRPICTEEKTSQLASLERIRDRIKPIQMYIHSVLERLNSSSKEPFYLRTLGQVKDTVIELVYFLRIVELEADRAGLQRTLLSNQKRVLRVRYGQLFEEGIKEIVAGEEGEGSSDPQGAARAVSDQITLLEAQEKQMQQRLEKMHRHAGMLEKFLKQYQEKEEERERAVEAVKKKEDSFFSCASFYLKFCAEISKED